MLVNMFNFVVITLGILLSLNSFADSEYDELLKQAKQYEAKKADLSPEALNSLDTFKLLAQEVVKGPKQEKFSKIIDLKQVEVTLFSQGQVVGDLSLGRGTQVPDVKGDKVELSFQGRVFHRINLKVSQVATYKNTVFFKTAEGIYFLDLASFRESLGKSEIPLFKLPVDKKLLGKNFRFGGRNLKIGEIEISERLIKIYSDAQRIAFRISANMVDPRFHSEALPVIESLKEYFQRTLDRVGQGLETQAESVKAMTEKVISMQKEIQRDFKLQETLAGKFGELTPEQKSELQKMVSEQAVDRMEKDITSGEDLKSKYENVTSNLQTSRKMTTRLHWIWARMSMPTPNAARKIKSALTFVKETLVYKKVKVMNDAFESMSAKSQRGAAITGAALTMGIGAYLGMQYQVELAGFLHHSLDTTKAVLSSVFGELNMLKNIGYTAGEAGKATVDSFNPFVVKEAYFNETVLPKIGVGLTAIISSLYVVIGTPHIVINSIKLYEDLKNKHFEKFYEAHKTNGLGSRKAKLRAIVDTFFSKENFIERQREQHRKYLDILSSAHSNGEAQEFTEKDHQEVEKILSELQRQEGKNRGFLTRFFSKVNILKYIKKDNKKEKTAEIKTFGKAFQNFLFSYAAFTQTGYVYTTIWNKWFVFRSFALRPTTWYTFLAYPNYYEKIVTPVEGVNIIMPTKFNGGTRTRISKWFSKLDKEKLGAWEEKIFTLEEKVHNEAIKKSFIALSQNIKSDKELKNLLESGVIKSIFDKRVRALKKKQQIYFEKVFQSLFNASMEKILKKANIVALDRNFEITDINRLSMEDIHRLEGIVDVEKVVNEEWSNNRDKIMQEAKGQIKDSFIKPSLSLLRNSAATARVQSTNKHGKKPLRMAQAVRYMIAKNLVDKPMELMFMFVGLSAIQMSGLGQELIRPIQEVMFSENSWFYLSRYTFLNGFLMGVVTGVMADVWYKLQVGENQKSDIGEVPTGKDAKTSYLKWYLKKTADKDNSWWTNQKHYVKLIYANMPAAIVTYMTFNFITLGRFDVDSYLIGYIAAYLLPTSGLNFKLENGFELASGYFFKDIPEKFRSHPKVQEYAGNLTHKKRLAFNLFYTTYENILGMFIFTLNSMETEKLGTRSFTRSIFGGWTITEKIAETADKVKVAIEVSNLPGKEGLTKVVDILCKPLTNNFTDWSKFKPKD